ncbi:S-layer homology domain-containing protein [Anaerotignum sp.]|uniref:S-layer homology domain-containing protein n=1 Tax=Anaerotignum sp. TaxID=2039241 RepID=UPI0027B9A735|nr:S-layer homology domain-containing protein [Anaerotignum sp.]
MKRFLTLATTAALVLGSTNAVAFGSTFADINTVPWPGAATFIDEAASLGLMSGYTENGKKYCKPRNKVTYCEATQLMYSIMKTYYKQDVTNETITKWKPIMDAYKIPSWAYNAVAYALDKGILVTNDLTKFMKGNTQQNANREDVGVIFGKALGKVYTVDMDAKLTFKDAGSISKASVPYLDLLYDKNIMVGDDYNNFNPKVNINRSEMAVLSVKTYKLLTGSGSSGSTGGTTTKPETPSNGSVTGTIVNVSVLENGDLFCSVKTNTGTGLNLFGKKGTAKAYYDGKEIDFSEIGTGDSVSLSYANGDIKTITVTKSVNGIGSKQTFDLVDMTSNKITVKDSSKEKTYTMADDVKVYLDDKSTTPSRIYSALDNGDDFSVTIYLNADDKVTKLYATTKNDNPKSGLLTDLDDNELTIKVNGKSYDYDVDSNVDVKDELTDYSFSDLKKHYDDTDFYVTLTTNSKNAVTKITVNYAEDEVNGVLTDVTSRKLTIKAQGDTYTYNLDSDVDVKVDGKSKDIDFLKENHEKTSYRVSLTLNRDDDVTDIVAIEESMGESKGIIKRLSSSTIEIKNDKGDTFSYDLLDDTDDIDVTLNGKSADFDDLKDKYKEYDIRAELSFKNKQVSKIVAVNTEADKGELRAIDEDEITILVDGDKFTYNLDDDVEVTLEDDDYSLSKLIKAFNDYENFEVKLKFNSSKSKVTEIEADYASSKRKVKGDLDGISSSYIKVDGKKYYLSKDFDKDDDVYGDAKDYDDLDDKYDDGNGTDFIIKLKLNSSGEVTRIDAEKD